jgi:hypothetical protein
MTVSGLSSGGFFAHQFHIAYSELVAGAGIVAGGPTGASRRSPTPTGPSPRSTGCRPRSSACTHYWGDRFWGLRPSPPDASDSVA